MVLAVLRFRKTLSALALGLIAITAFGTANQPAPPPLQRVVEQISIQPQALLAKKISFHERDAFVRSAQTRRGQALDSLLHQLGVDDATFRRFVSFNPVAKDLLKLKPGTTVTAELAASGQIRSMYFASPWKSYQNKEVAYHTEIQRYPRGFRAVRKISIPQMFIDMASLSIKTSLFAATDAERIPETIAVQIADILDGEPDFKQDLRRGEHVRVVFERFVDPNSLDPPRAGRVLALEISGQGRHYEAVWFERDKGKGAYFSLSGRNLQKGFLRYPVEYTRISSGFSLHRTHPIFGFSKEHTGIDFAAAIGTKVRSASSGTVKIATYQRGYGNTVLIQHNQKLSTRYAHLSGFAPGMAVGQQVGQGQVVGYVGNTGRSTGSHLHYEIIQNGRPVDPMKAVLPIGAHPLSAREMARFQSKTDLLKTALANAPLVQLAKFE